MYLSDEKQFRTMLNSIKKGKNEEKMKSFGTIILRTIINCFVGMGEVRVN